MGTETYNNREIDNALEAVHQSLGEIKSEIQEVKFEVKQTNGRVRNLEQWRWFIMGGLSVLTIIVIPIAFIFISALIKA